MDAIEPKFKLECECGFNTFYISHELDGDKCEIRCEGCDRIIAYISRYGINWIEKEKKDVVSSD